MPSLTTTVEPTVELTPRQQVELRGAFQQYQHLKQRVEEAQAKLDAMKAMLGRFREKIGEESVGLDGFKVTLVQGTSSRLNKKKLRLVGVTQAQIDMATTTSPKKPYELVTCPGEKTQTYEEEE